MDATAAHGMPRWTDDDKNLVADLLRAGRSAGQIARQFPPTTRNAIIGLVHRDKMLTAVGFANSNRGQPGLKPPAKKPAMTHRPENRFAAPVKPQLMKAAPKPRARKPICGKPVTAAPMHVPMLDIGANQCRFPMWNGDGRPDFLMCGAATPLERSYCVAHAAQVFTPRER